LCIGLDPAISEQRSTNIIPAKYLKYSDENEVKLNFCLDLIRCTKDFCCAYKPNQQYIAGFTKKDHQTLTNAINKVGSISILDYKLNDIDDTMHSALFHIQKWGYDAVTFNPFLGNLQATVELAHQIKLGIIVLTLTSNIEASKYQKEAKIHGKELYTIIAEDVKKYEADGCVVGATGHITENEIRRIRTIVGEETIFLVPGIGTQKGDPSRVIRSGGVNLLINVGRDIIYSQDPEEKARKYNNLFNEIRFSS